MLKSTVSPGRRVDDESCLESESNLVAKEIGDLIANIDQSGLATNRFLMSPAANGIAGFLFSEMYVKEQGLVKLRSKFAFHSSVSAATQSELSQSGSCGGRATLFRSHFAISLASFRLHSARTCWFRLVIDDPLVERHTCDVCFRLLDLQHGHRRVEPSEALRDFVLPSQMLGSPSSSRVIGMCCLPSCLNQAGLPNQRTDLAPV